MALRFCTTLLEIDGITADDEEKMEWLLSTVDVVTRWSSLYLMIEKALALRRAIDFVTAIEELREHGMTSNEWQSLSELLELLHPFSVVAKLIEADKYANLCSVVPLYNTLLDFLEDWIVKEGHTIETRRAARAALRKLKEYYNRLTPVYIISTVMDPRLKLDYFLRNGFSEGSVQSNGENLIDTRIKPP